MRVNPYVGRTVMLLACAAYDDENKAIEVTGLWTVEEFLAAEPAAYISCDCFSLGNGETWIVVDADVLIEQIDPRAHADSLVREREIDEALWQEYSQRVQEEA